MNYILEAQMENHIIYGITCATWIYYYVFVSILVDLNVLRQGLTIEESNKYLLDM